jgi:hypothetical protein
MKYAVLNIDTECGGDACFTTIDSEKELQEVIGSYNSYNCEVNGLKLYNDGEEDFSTVIILNETGLEKVRKAINGANPFDSKKIKINDYLKKDDGSDDDY